MKKFYVTDIAIRAVRNITEIELEADSEEEVRAIVQEVQKYNPCSSDHLSPKASQLYDAICDLVYGDPDMLEIDDIDCGDIESDDPDDAEPERVQ